MDRKRLLFVCVENANRSQMAEAFARLHGGAAVEAMSAGSRPSGRINPKAVRAMAERGVDLTAQASTGLDALDGLELDAAVTMGCGDACPRLRATLREDWDIPDPGDLDEPGFDAVRDEIERQVKALLVRVGVSDASQGRVK